MQNKLPTPSGKERKGKEGVKERRERERKRKEKKRKKKGGGEGRKKGILPIAALGDLTLSDSSGTPGNMSTYSCSPWKILESPPYVIVPRPRSLFPVACICSPPRLWIPHAGCISLKS